MAVSLGYFMVILDATAVNLALPALGQDLGGGITGLQWVVDGYTLAFAALLLSSGVAADRFGPRRVFLTGLVLFTAASAGCALAPAIGVLVLIRLIQGAAAALLVPSSLALVQASYPDRASRARAVGLWGGIGGLAAASGPVLGGALTAAASWRLVFAINIPVGLLAWWLTRRRVASPLGQRDRRGDPIGQITAIVTLTALVAGLIKAGPHGWASWPVAAGLAIAAAAATAFVAAQRRVRSPMLPLPLLRRPALSGGSAVGLLINLGFYGQLFAYSLYLQQVRGDSPLIAGLSLLPEAAAVPVASVLSGRLTSRRGTAGHHDHWAGAGGGRAARPDRDGPRHAVLGPGAAHGGRRVGDGAHHARGDHGRDGRGAGQPRRDGGRADQHRPAGRRGPRRRRGRLAGQRGGGVRARAARGPGRVRRRVLAGCRHHRGHRGPGPGAPASRP